MGLVRSSDEIAQREKHFSSGYLFEDGVMIMAVFRTNADVVRRVLPPPLEPAPAPTGLAYMTELRRTNFGGSYCEAGVFLFAQYNGEVGKYCLSMPVTDDMALVWGREIYGYPKKLADTIRIQREGTTVTGVCIRKGIRGIEIAATLTGTAEPGAIPPAAPNFLFKYAWNPRYPRQGTFDSTPKLIKQRNEIDWGKVEVGQGTLTLAASKFDPVGEIPVEEVLTVRYAEDVDVRMLPGEVIAEVDPVKFLPYSFIKYDWELPSEG